MLTENRIEAVGNSSSARSNAFIRLDLCNRLLDAFPASSFNGFLRVHRYLHKHTNAFLAATQSYT